MDTSMRAHFAWMIVAMAALNAHAAPVRYAGSNAELTVARVSGRTVEVRIAPLDPNGRPVAEPASSVLVSSICVTGRAASGQGRTSGVGRRKSTSWLATSPATRWLNMSGSPADRLPAIEKDLAEMEKLCKEKAATAAEAEGSGRPAGVALLATALAAAATPAPRPRCEHLPPLSFRPGEPVVIELAIEAGYRITRARLH